MNGAVIIGILIIIAALLVTITGVVMKGIRSGRIGAGAAKFFAFIGVLAVMVIFVLLMGVLKNLQG